jgi:ribonuclease R
LHPRGASFTLRAFQEIILNKKNKAGRAGKRGIAKSAPKSTRATGDTARPPRKTRSTAAAKAANAPAKRKPKPALQPARKLPPWMPEPPPATRADPRRRPGTDASPKTRRRDDPHAAREARRYDRPIPSREAILALLEDCGQLLTTEKIAAALGLDEAQDIEALTKRLAAMVRDAQLFQNRRGGYALARKLDLISGTVLANADGYGFLRPDEGGEDLYLSPAQMRTVLHGDRVLASVVGVDHRGRRKGAVVEVLDRRSPRLVGNVVVDKGVTLVAPDDSRLQHDILIPPGQDLGAHAGQIVIAEITDQPTIQRGPIGRIVSILGDRLQPSLVVEMAIAHHDLPHEWPQAVTREVEQMPIAVSEEECAARTDLRRLPLVTIDGADSRDFDDAVWAEAGKGGGYRLIVAIADVSHYVRPGSAIDVEAYERGTSTYFPGFVVPMLPEPLSNGLCSLNPDVDRLCMACDMQVGADGEIVRSRFYPAVMRSHARLTYNEVWKIVGENDRATRAKHAPRVAGLETLYALYKTLDKARKRRGTIEFDTVEVKFALGASGEVVSMGAEPRNDAHKLIEVCMIAANVEAARFLERRKIPALYRVHAPPRAEKYEDLQEFLRQYKLKLPPHDQVTPADYTRLLDKVRDRPEFNLIQSLLLRSQSMAVYGPENEGHFGLALDAYAHFTSPIRRYPDLLVHRAIHYALGKGRPANYEYNETEMASMGVQCSQRERRAEEAERDVDERFKCAWMEKYVGSTFDGIVTGVTSFGLFVELAESRVSGLVHITQLPNDYYHFDAANHLLAGERRGLRFRLGDEVRVQVLRASMEERKIDFRLVASGEAVGREDRRAPQRSAKGGRGKKRA